MLVSSTNRLQFELNSLIENTSYTEVDVWSNVMYCCVFVLLDNSMDICNRILPMKEQFFSYHLTWTLLSSLHTLPRLVETTFGVLC